MKLAVAVLTLALLPLVFAKDRSPPTQDDSDVVKMDQFIVHGRAVSNFAVDVEFLIDRETRQISRMFITAVAKDSDASRLGLQRGDEIVKIDGVPVKGMDSKINKDSQIGRIFLNRKQNDPLDLEVITRRTQQVTLHAHAGPPLR